MARNNENDNSAPFSVQTRDMPFCPKCQKHGWLTYYVGVGVELPRYYYLLKGMAVPCVCEVGDMVYSIAYQGLKSKEIDNLKHFRKIANMQASRAYAYDKELMGKSEAELKEMVNDDLTEWSERQ